MSETYTDSRGADMESMTFSEALERVYDLASGNMIDANDEAFGDAGLAAQRSWQKQALDTLHDFVANHSETLDDLAPVAAAGDWPDDLIRADRSMDPDQPLNAIRICLAMATEAAQDPAQVDNPEDADDVDLEQQAFDVVRDLIGTHAAELEAIRVINLGQIN